MGQRVTIDDAIRRQMMVLFDASVLFDAYASSTGRTGDVHAARVRRLLERIAAPRRFTTALVLWQFLQGSAEPGRVPSEIENRARLEWLESEQIEVRREHPSSHFQTLGTLAERHDRRGDAVDGSLAAFVIASDDPVALATSDERGFCWHPKILVIVEFFRDERACA